MTKFDRSDWEGRWSRALREHADQVAHRPPNAHLTRRGRQPAPRIGARRRLRSRGRRALACRARMAGHRGRLLRHRPGARPVDGRGRGGGRRRAHRLGRGRSHDLDPAAGPPRPRRLPVRARGGVGRGDGAADGGRGRSRGDPVPRRPPPDRPGDGSRNGRGRSGAGLGRRRDRCAGPRPLGSRSSPRTARGPWPAPASTR